MENRKLTAEVFIDTGKDFRPEDSLQAEYSCAPGEIQTLEFDLRVFESTCGFRFDPLLEDSSMVKLLDITLTYEDGESKSIDFRRIKTNSDVDFEPIFVYLHKDPKFFVDEALCLKLTKASVKFQVLELGVGGKEYWQEIKKHSVSEKEKEQLLNKLELAMNQNHGLEQENRRLKIEEADIYASGIWKLQHDAKGPLKVIFGKGNILTFLAAVYLALCSELFIFNNAYYSTPRPNGEVLTFSFLRFGMVWLGAFVVIAVINGLIQKGYRRELY